MTRNTFVSVYVDIHKYTDITLPIHAARAFRNKLAGGTSSSDWLDRPQILCCFFFCLSSSKCVLGFLLQTEDYNFNFGRLIYAEPPIQIQTNVTLLVSSYLFYICMYFKTQAHKIQAYIFIRVLCKNININLLLYINIYLKFSLYYTHNMFLVENLTFYTRIPWKINFIVIN